MGAPDLPTALAPLAREAEGNAPGNRDHAHGHVFKMPLGYRRGKDKAP